MDVFSEALAGTTLLEDDGNEVPQAFLNYLLYDTAFQLIDQGFVRVSEAAKVTVGQGEKRGLFRKGLFARASAATEAASTTNNPETLALDVEINQPGYLYAYVSNESNWDAPVFFDGMQARLTEQLTVVDRQDYYPFGATHESLAPNPTNRYLYQGKEITNNLGLGLYDFHARQYDPYLGRFTSIDPMASSFAGMSPYAGMGNNPISYTDPTGEFLIPFSFKFALIGAGVGGVAGGVIAESQGKDFWKGFGYGAAIGFGVGGFLGSDFAKVNIWGTHTASGLVPQQTGLFKGLESINPIIKGPILKGPTIGTNLLFNTPLLQKLPTLPGLNLPVSQVLNITQPYFNPPPTEGVSMVDLTRVFDNTMPNMQPQLATGQNILRNIARYLNVVNQTGQQPQSISIIGVNTSFLDRGYTSTSVNGGVTNTIRHQTSRALNNRFEFIRDELIRLGAPPQSINPSFPRFRYRVGNSRILFRYGN